MPDQVKDKLSLRWKGFLAFAIVVGLALRLIWTSDMEWKEDEYYDFVQTLLIGHGKPWPWAGMNSGVYLANPGMSVWVFVWLARIAGATTPIALQRALGVASVFGIVLLIPFALFFVGRGHNDDIDDREPWLWACALALVNPFAIYMQRKLWPEGFFTIFSTVMLMGWWKRDKKLGAFAWGLVGALLGQIHMSGFFYAFAFFIYTALFNSYSIPRKTVKWGYWFAGSVLGALPLIPWYLHVRLHPPPGQVFSGGWGDAIQLKYWVFWITDPLGLHLGNPLGLHLGGSVWAQISDFARYPLLNGTPTYLCAFAHATALIAGVWIVGGGLVHEVRHVLGKSATIRWIFYRKLSQTAFAQNSALFGYGVLITATCVNIRRYYLAVTFPLENLWLTRIALMRPGKHATAEKFLLLLWISQLAISTEFVLYVHENNGALNGDYGEAYHVIEERHRVERGETWPDLKLLPEDSR